MDEQREVAAFVDRHDIETSLEFRLLTMVEEIGEMAEDAVETTGYGERPEEIGITEEELGDTMFTLLQIANAADIDAGKALERTLEKYDERIDETGNPSSE